MWSKVIYKGEDLTLQETLSQAELSPESFTNHLARGLYNDIKLLSKTLWSSEDGSHEFNNLPENEKSFWYNYAAGIPGKLSKLNLFIRPFADFCRTCIITDKEIETLVQTDLDRYCKTADKFVPGGNENERERDLQSTERPVYNPDSDWKRLYIELNCLIPVQLKKAGYEIVRHEEVVEINMPMIRKLARAIHSRYLNEIRSRSSESDLGENKYFFFTPGDSSRRSVSDFDELPDEIKYSNIDNAVHIPTKLLAIGFKIRPVKKGFKSVTLHLKDDEIEAMAKIEHIRWSWEKRLAGWIYDTFKDDSRKTHPSLVPYEELSEQEKEKDRKLVKLIPALLQDIDYEAYPVSPNRIKKLSYAIKSQGLIQKILDETRELNEQIRTRAELTPEIEAIVGIRNKKIEEAIREIEGSYRYAQHIQETFLPDDLYVRECFPESFILFKPKDLISGDFYFFSRQDDLIIFAAADCTGHGIPGALLSTLGYGILDQAVNEIKLKDPKYIL